MKARLLLFGDDGDAQRLCGMLQRAGFSCQLAAGMCQAKASLGSLSALDALVLVMRTASGDHTRRGLDLLGQLRSRGVRAPALLVADRADAELVKLALRAGAVHLLERPFRADQLAEAVERAISAQDFAAATEGVFDRASLTHKERVVARYLLAGRSSSEIAALEQNSPKTIRQHVSEIYAKCDARNRADFLCLVYARWALGCAVAAREQPA